MDADELYRLIENSWRNASAPLAVLLAVSGGGDSAALLRVGARLKSTGVAVSAATVDHGLRIEAAREAQSVAAWSAKLGVPHATLVWTDEKPQSGLQAAARAARYRLLARHAADIGAHAILTAHTQDDVAETFLMRLARGAGAEGLAEMSRQRLVAAGAHDPVLLLRPWLDVRRSDLRNFMTAADAPFVDDPSNDDVRFERVRLRQFMPVLAEATGIESAALARSARRLAGDAEIRRIAIRDAFDAADGVFYRWGGVSVSADRKASADIEPALFARLVFAVSGEEYPPGEEQSARAFADLSASGRSSLGGAIIERFKERIWFYREPGALLGRAGVEPCRPMKLVEGARQIWDRRFIVGAAEACEIIPAGQIDARAAAQVVLFEGPRGALDSLPALKRQDGACGFLFVSPPPHGVTCLPLAPERFAGKVNRF